MEKKYYKVGERFEALYIIKDIKKIYTGQENSVIVEMSLEEYKNYQNFKKAKV